MEDEYRSKSDWNFRNIDKQSFGNEFVGLEMVKIISYWFFYFIVLFFFLHCPILEDDWPMGRYLWQISSNSSVPAWFTVVVSNWCSSWISIYVHFCNKFIRCLLFFCLWPHLYPIFNRYVSFLLWSFPFLIYSSIFPKNLLNSIYFWIAFRPLRLTYWMLSVFANWSLKLK